MPEKQKEHFEGSEKLKNIDKILLENPRYKQILHSHIGTKLTNKLIRQISSFSISKELSKQEVKKLFDELMNKIDYIDNKIGKSFFEDIKEEGEKGMLPGFTYIELNKFLNGIKHMINKEKSKKSISNIETKSQMYDLININQLVENETIKLSFLQIKHLNNKELSKFGSEFAEKYEKLLIQALPNYLQLYSILGTEMKNQPEFDGFAGYWRFWSKYVNRDPIMMSNSYIIQSKIIQLKQSINHINKSMLVGNKEQAINSLNYIENNIFGRLESQIKDIVDNDSGLLGVDLSNIQQYKANLDNGDKFAVQEFMTEILKKPEYISYYINSGLEINNENLNNILLTETNQKTIKEFFSTNKITICGKQIILKDEIDFSDILEDAREEAKDLIGNLEAEKPGITEPEKNKIMLNYIKNKFIKELLDSADQTNLTNGKGDSKIFELYYENDTFIKDLERNWTGYVIKGTIVAAACYGTLGFGDKLLGAAGTGVMLETGGLKLFASKFAMDVGIFHTTATSMGNMINGGNINQLGHELSNAEGWAQTALFMGVLAGVTNVLEGLGHIKQLQGAKQTIGQLPAGTFALKGVNFGTQVGAVIGVENLVFDGEFTAEQLINAIIFVGMLNIRRKMRSTKKMYYMVSIKNGKELEITQKEPQEQKLLENQGKDRKLLEDKSQKDNLLDYKQTVTFQSFLESVRDSDGKALILTKGGEKLLEKLYLALNPNLVLKNKHGLKFTVSTRCRPVVF